MEKLLKENGYRYVSASYPFVCVLCGSTKLYARQRLLFVAEWSGEQCGWLVGGAAAAADVLCVRLLRRHEYKCSQRNGASEGQATKSWIWLDGPRERSVASPPRLRLAPRAKQIFRFGSLFLGLRDEARENGEIFDANGEAQSGQTELREREAQRLRRSTNLYIHMYKTHTHTDRMIHKNTHTHK